MCISPLDLKMSTLFIGRTSQEKINDAYLI